SSSLNVEMVGAMDITPMRARRVRGVNGNSAHDREVARAGGRCEQVVRGKAGSMPAGHFAAGGLEEEPDALFGFVDPDFEEAAAGDVAVLGAEVVDLAHAGHEGFVVFAELGEHVFGL